jgi:hypothetical protein
VRLTDAYLDGIGSLPSAGWSARGRDRVQRAMRAQAADR